MRLDKPGGRSAAVPSAIRRDPRIEACFLRSRRSAPIDDADLVRAPARLRRRRARAAARRLSGRLRGDAPFGYVNAFKAHANVGFFHGATLADPAGLLVGEGKRMRHVKLRPGTELDVEALSDLIAAAYHDIRRRLNSPPG